MLDRVPVIRLEKILVIASRAFAVCFLGTSPGLVLERWGFPSTENRNRALLGWILGLGFEAHPIIVLMSSLFWIFGRRKLSRTAVGGSHPTTLLGQSALPSPCNVRQVRMPVDSTCVGGHTSKSSTKHRTNEPAALGPLVSFSSTPSSENLPRSYQQRSTPSPGRPLYFCLRPTDHLRRMQAGCHFFCRLGAAALAA